MLSKLQQAALNLEEARGLRASGAGYREIGRKLGLSSAQLSHIRRALRREKAAGTRLKSAMPGATSRDLPVAQSGLPAGLRKNLVKSGYRTLGDLADRVSDPALPRIETIPGIGPHKADLVKRLLEYYGLLAGRSDLPAEIERLFPEFF
ncbi:hypothetical protein E5A73_17885 [Sphingomonas gei]|uniref:Uncharacterized protein n=1 Tax=Sphingomonas gei TaxID=1395960 RepID=A0A4S1X2X9_9SPHN|nr:hypothetical protein E5A73_17885 [Sphingomonas gei]